jgi:hypothetical protein
MSKDNVDDLIRDYLSSGGDVVRLRYAGKKDMEKSQRNSYHKDRADCGSQKSKMYLQKQSKKEVSLIFSKVDRWRK